MTCSSSTPSSRTRSVGSSARHRSLTWASSTTTTITESPSDEPGPRAGLFIAFEGVEGAGKSTQLRLVAEALRGRGIEPIVTREPGGTAVGETLREWLLDEGRTIGTLTELFLILAARAAFVEEVVAPALEAGRIVLTDRYDLSTFAYQGGGRGLDLGRLREVNQVATAGIRPDLYIVLDVDVRDGRARQPSRVVDRIESEAEGFHRRVAETYRQLAESQPDVALVDGRGEIEVVFRSVWQVLATHFPETFPAAPG